MCIRMPSTPATTTTTHISKKKSEQNTQKTCARVSYVNTMMTVQQYKSKDKIVLKEEKNKYIVTYVVFIHVITMYACSPCCVSCKIGRKAWKH